eukprot:CAMPEP_0170468148 /NCGR_PEP_ID=MMETSP0123-20130129/11440_1 /TAXON_ID=182087 /ORGANISM="Favella ehrenbergii, Strain Fehren 1" /LENGTH=145 /DNA_ID=CAMNT_0010734651 /DNA_START=964 /DNA_END=1401 /DNA_ORIENTATION=+
MTEYEKKRALIAQMFRPRYRWFNFVFAYILTTLTLRTGVYIGFRFVGNEHITASEKIFEWSLIRPVVFYLTYATDIMIVIGVLYFIYTSTQLKTKYMDDIKITVTTTKNYASADNSAIQNVDGHGVASDESSLDGDALILQQKRE